MDYSKISRSEISEKNKKLENLYPYNEENQKLFLEKNPAADWSFLFFQNLGPYCKSRFDLFKSKFETIHFINGLKYEFGYENTPINLEKAYSIYKEAADKTNDYLSMYKMYVIHLREYEKFLKKNDKILEIFYLAKCIAYLPFSYLDFARSLCQIDPIFELALHFDQEDPQVEKFFDMLNLLQNNPKYNISDDTLLLIRKIISYQFEVGEYQIFGELEELSDKGNLEATYKYACLLLKEESDNDTINKYFERCVNKKYYRAYADYGKFLFYNMSQYNKSLQLLKEGCENGCFECFSLYYDIYAFLIDFTLLEKKPFLAREYTSCLQYLIDSISTGQIFDIIEVFSFKNIFIKHYKMKKYLDDNYQKYINEIIQFLLNVKEDENYLKKYSSEELGLFECIRSLALIYVSGNDEIVQKNIIDGQILLKKCYKLGSSNSNKAYTYSLIYKIRKQLFKDKQITEEKFNKTKHKLFLLYDSRLSDKNLNHSFFYFIGKLFANGIGTTKDIFKAYIFFEEAVNYEKKNINYSIVSYYRKYKSSLLLQKEFYKKVKENFNKTVTFKLNEDGEENICFICRYNTKNLILYPCTHTMCNVCYDKIKQEDKCPFCRSKILRARDFKYVK